jgi:hypothetical protein
MKMARCKSGGALRKSVPESQKENNKGNVYADVSVYKLPMILDRPLPSPSMGGELSTRTKEALQLENEHLNGIIQVMEIKVRKTEDLGKELALLRDEILKEDHYKRDMLETINSQAHALLEHRTKNEKF